MTKQRKINYKDWNDGPVVTASRGCPLRADAWDGKMLRPSAGGALPGSTMLVRPVGVDSEYRWVRATPIG